jgi:hypothetical protein
MTGSSSWRAMRCHPPSLTARRHSAGETTPMQARRDDRRGDSPTAGAALALAFGVRPRTERARARDSTSK